MSSSNASEIVRRSFLKISEETIFEAVDTLDLRGHSRISAVVGIPLRNLQQKRDITVFATSAPIAAVRGLLELISMKPLQDVIDALGDNADNPTFDQLRAAVDVIKSNGSTTDDVVAMLAFAVGEEVPAAGHCLRLLEEIDDYRLPALPEALAPSSLLSPKEIDPAIKEQRKARREAEKAKKQKKVTPPARPAKVKPESKPTPVVSAPVPSAPVPEVTRRSLFLTPLEIEKFDPTHPLVGAVVSVDVPFDAVDPENPELKSKVRPALVVAASSNGVLVRAIYSKEGVNRQIFNPWRRLNLSKISYIADARIPLEIATDAVAKIGFVNDEEWNAVSQ